MELEVRPHGKKITDLRRELVEMLCKYLSADDIVNVCIAIPSWEWILFLHTPYSYINKWKWIDRKVCTTLNSGPVCSGTANVCKAIEQHFSQMKFDLQFPSIIVPDWAYRRVSYFLFLSILAKWSNVYRTPHPLEVNILFKRGVIAPHKLTSIYAEALEYDSPQYFYYRRPGPERSQLVKTELARVASSLGEIFPMFNCIFYVLKVSTLTGHTSNVAREVQYILRALSPAHTFGIVVMDDMGGKEDSGMALFMDYADKLGFFKGSPLMTTPIDWRIWHIKDCKSHINDRKDIIEWMCQTVIWRRLQEWQLY